MQPDFLQYSQHRNSIPDLALETTSLPVIRHDLI